MYYTAAASKRLTDVHFQTICPQYREEASKRIASRDNVQGSRSHPSTFVRAYLPLARFLSGRAIWNPRRVTKLLVSLRQAFSVSQFQLLISSVGTLKIAHSN